MNQYSMNYGGGEAAQINTPRLSQNDNAPDERHNPARSSSREIRFRIPSILKTALTFAAGAGVLIGWEMAAPDGYRPSTFVGVYDARIAAAVKASELQQQVAFDNWSAQVKLAADQQSEQYKAISLGIINNYGASYEMGKIATQAAMEMQGRYATTIMNQKTQEQGTDIGIINLVRGFARIAEALEPGAGASALEYANGLSSELQNEVTDAARKGTGTSVVTWGVGIASPEEVAATLRSIKPLQLPPPPVIGEKRTTIGGLPAEGK